MKKVISLILAAFICVGLFGGCSEKKVITIYSTGEDFRNEHAREMLKSRFPEYKIDLVDIDTGTLATKVSAEGNDFDGDIIFELEATYLEKVSDKLAVLDKVDYGVFREDLVPENHKYTPLSMLSGSVIINKKLMEKNNLEYPKSYDDLLKPEYKGLISMPSPKTSSTGYIFLLNMVNERGEDAAFEYFDKLAENMSGQSFTTSGSGPVKALVQNEAAIGLGITFQAVKEINEGAEFDLLIFDEGAPYDYYGSAVMAGKETDEDVMKVFDYIISDVSPEDKRLYMPEKVYKEQDTHMENFPEDIKYGNMEGLMDINIKERLLDKWMH